MKKGIRFFALIMALLLQGMCFAATMPVLNVQSVLYGDKLELLLYCSHASKLTPENLQITLDDKPITLESVTQYGERTDGTTWIYIVDTASVSTNDGDEPIIDTLEYFLKKQSNYDNAAIVSTGTTFDEITLRSDLDELKSEIGKMMANTSVTTLNATISEAIRFADSHEDVRPHVSIVVLSGGETSNQRGQTYDELIKLIDETDITVYTIAFVYGEPSDAVNVFGSIARNSCGGLDILADPYGDEPEAVRIVDTVMANEQNFVVVTIDTAKQGVSGTKLHIETKVGWHNLEADITVSIEGGDPKPDINWDLIIITGSALAAVIIIVIAVLVFVGKSRRNRAIDNDGPPIEPVPEPSEPTPQSIITVPDDVHSNNIQVTLSVVNNNGGHSYTEMINDGLVIGSLEEISRLVIKGDPKISRRHMMLRYENNMMIAEDCGSRNGTRINGVLIDRPTILHQQDVITIGVTSMKITWWNRPYR